MTFSVRTADLSAGVDKVAALFGDCDKVSSAMAGTLGGMISAAGHPALVDALASFTESSANAMVATGKTLTYIGAGLKQSATRYATTESTNAGKIAAAGRAR